MNYNSNQKKLIMPEYGRNLQRMVDHVVEIQDRDERNKAAQKIIDIMGNMYPYLRDIPDFKHKLWDHIAIMSDFRLDIDSPYPAPTPKLLKTKPKSLAYPQTRISLKHYGRIIEEMLQKAIEYPEGEEKEYLIQILANHLKKSYLAWNKETVSDEQIKKDLYRLSKGKLVLSDETKLSESKNLINKRKNQNTDKKKQNNRKNTNFRKKH